MSQTSLTGDPGGYTPNPSSQAYDEIRPLSVRMRDSVRAQLDVLAQLNDRSVTEETRLALEHWVERAKTDPSLKERADRVKAEIDREAESRRKSIDRDAANRRHAIAAVLGVEDNSAEENPDTEVHEDADDEAEASDTSDEIQEEQDPSPEQPEQAAEEIEGLSTPAVKAARIRRGKPTADTSGTAKAS